MAAMIYKWLNYFSRVNKTILYAKGQIFCIIIIIIPENGKTML